MQKLTISRLEIFVLSFVLLLTVTGIAGSHINVDWYDLTYAAEDHFIEWFTVIPLLITSGLAISYIIKLALKRSWLFSVCLGFIAVLTFFAAGEEISWGQRIFNIKSSEWLEKNNAQGETNLHNLKVNGIKVNKIITLVLGIAAGIYIIIIPLLYRYNNKFKQFVNWAGVPVAQLYQIAGIIAVALLHLLIQSNKGKQPEVFEFGVCFMFLLIVAFPLNRQAFRSQQPLL